MALQIEEKRKFVERLNGLSKQAVSAVVVNYTGVSANEMNLFRKKSRDNGVILVVLRNRLTKLALKGTSFEPVADALEGSAFLCAFSLNHPGAGARMIKEQFKTVKSGAEVKTICFEGKLLPPHQLDWLAAFPTKEEAIAKLAYLLKEAGAGRFARLLAQVRSTLPAQ